MRLRCLLILSVFPIVFSGCQRAQVGTDEIDQIMKLSSDNIGQVSEIESLRYNMLRDTALAFSSQKAFAKYAQIINNQLLEHESVLNNSFDFQPLLLKDNVVPPVILESSKRIDSPNSQTLIVSDKTFQIYHPAYFQTAPLSWRNFLLLEEGYPTYPDRSLLPRNRVEQEVWSDFTQVGWKAGRDLAFATLDENFKHLNRHYQGMVNYHRLLMQGLVTSPEVRTQEQGIVSSGDLLSINKKILSIDTVTSFNENSELWHSFIFFHPTD